VDPVQLLLKNMLTAAAAFMIQPSCIITVYKPPAHIVLRCQANLHSLHKAEEAELIL